MNFAALRKNLAAPLHAQPCPISRNDASQQPGVDLSRGCLLQFEDQTVRRQLETSVADFKKFLFTWMHVQNQEKPYYIRIATGKPDGCPLDAPEAFHIHISPHDGTITASDTDGIRRALVYLEDEMLLRQVPSLTLGSISRWAVIKDRITRSPLAPYRWLTGWELERNVEKYYPDEYLNKLMHCGMNGIWVAGLLRRLVATKSLPEIGPETHQLDSLKKLVSKASKYGIKVYLFCIEPRTLPPDHPVFKAHPEIRGAMDRSLCLFTPLVQEYIRETMRELFSEIPDLGGIINIFNGERPTTCWSWWSGQGEKKNVQTCPRCRNRPQVEVLAESLNCFMQGIRQVSKNAKLIAWDYGIPRTAEYKEKFPPLLHPEIIWMENFEHNGEKRVHGKKVEIHEYSLSSVGPSDYFAEVAQKITRQRRQIYAKLQIGNTYELATVPYIPVPQTAYSKLAAAQKCGVSGTMVSWIIGGYPEMMLKAAGEACFAPLIPQKQAIWKIAAINWGKEQAETVAEAWNLFSKVFKQYLCAIEVFYYGPITRCPAYQLHLENESALAVPYNWGLTRERNAQPFEDKVERWTGPFKPEELVKSFRCMGKQWKDGASMIYKCLKKDASDSQRQQWAVASAIRIQLLSAANVFEFYMLRDNLKKEAVTKQQNKILKWLEEIVRNDIALAEEMKELVSADPFIGFHSEIYEYSYSIRLLTEKIKQDTKTLKKIAQWQKSGIEASILNSSLPVKTSSRQPAKESILDPNWLRWGD